jgi:RHH-type transcriptional regulator, rel operon repressor / antitoxin RelB
LEYQPVAISIRLPEEIEERLDALAKLTGRTKSYYIREMIIEKIDDLEDYYLAVNRAELVRRGKDSVLSSEQVRRELDLDH